MVFCYFEFYCFTCPRYNSIIFVTLYDSCKLIYRMKNTNKNINVFSQCQILSAVKLSYLALYMPVRGF